MSKVVVFVECNWPLEHKNLPDELQVYFDKRFELLFENGIVMWQNRIVVPQSLHFTVLFKLHEGHPGICAMKSLARFLVWWPKIDNDIDGVADRCQPCQVNHLKEPETPLILE